MVTRAIASVKQLTSGWWPMEERHPLVQAYMAHSVCKKYDPAKRMSLDAYNALVKNCEAQLYCRAKQVVCATLFNETAKCTEHKKCIEWCKYIASKIAHMMARYIDVVRVLYVVKERVLKAMNAETRVARFIMLR
jgi:hypothetical protein